MTQNFKNLPCNLEMYNGVLGDRVYMAIEHHANKLQNLLEHASRISKEAEKDAILRGTKFIPRPLPQNITVNITRKGDKRVFDFSNQGPNDIVIKERAVVSIPEPLGPEQGLYRSIEEKIKQRMQVELTKINQRYRDTCYSAAKCPHVSADALKEIVTLAKARKKYRTTLVEETYKDLLKEVKKERKLAANPPKFYASERAQFAGGLN